MLDLYLKEMLLRKFLRFAAVGFSGLIVDYGVTAFFKEIIRIPKFLANALGFTLAATSNYYLNRLWTFQSQNPEILVEFSHFLLISIIGLAINTLILWIIIKKWDFNFYLSKAFAIAVVTLWNFSANAAFTFHSLAT
ncbi:MAG: GtrA family protein [Bacteroidales bacterium]